MLITLLFHYAAYLFAHQPRIARIGSTYGRIWRAYTNRGIVRPTIIGIRIPVDTNWIAERRLERKHNSRASSRNHRRVRKQTRRAA
jgi:hypothetical protein